MMIMENPFPIRLIRTALKLTMIRMNINYTPRGFLGFGDKPQIC